MDDFDIFNGPSQATPSAQTINVQEDNLFDAVNTTNIINSDQVNESSWTNESNVHNTITSAETLFNDEPKSQTATTKTFDSYSTSNFSEATNDTITNDTESPSEDTSSFDMFSKPMPSTPAVSTSIFTTGISSEENLSVLEAFNKRRQQEIQEKANEEQRKIEALRQQAKKELERWYNDRKVRKEQNRTAITYAENELRTKALEKSDKNQCDWPKVIRMLEFSSGTQLSRGKRDLNRMRSSMLNVKRHQEKRNVAEAV